jgi:hypothetical protein
MRLAGWIWVLTLLCAGLMYAGPGAAIDTSPPLPDPRLQQRYYELTHELRCMQCQSEALADSSVSLAADLRLQVRELLLAERRSDPRSHGRALRRVHPVSAAHDLAQRLAVGRADAAHGGRAAGGLAHLAYARAPER